MAGMRQGYRNLVLRVRPLVLIEEGDKFSHHLRDVGAVDFVDDKDIGPAFRLYEDVDVLTTFVRNAEGHLEDLTPGEIDGRVFGPRLTGSFRDSLEHTVGRDKSEAGTDLLSSFLFPFGWITGISIGPQALDELLVAVGLVKGVAQYVDDISPRSRHGIRNACSGRQHPPKGCSTTRCAPGRDVWTH